jgi:hypothetical protein
MLTNEQVRAILVSLARSRGNRGFTKEEAQKVVDWGNEADLIRATLKAVLNGEVWIDLDDKGEACFTIAPPDTPKIRVDEAASA